MQTERTDALAAIRTRLLVTDLLDNFEVADCDECGAVGLDSGLVNDALAGAFTARFEHRDNLRRVVLYSEWEVDPAAVASAAPACPPVEPATVAA
jgi:hypothetical protein